MPTKQPHVVCRACGCHRKRNGGSIANRQYGIKPMAFQAGGLYVVAMGLTQIEEI